MERSTLSDSDSIPDSPFAVRATRSEDIEAIIELCEAVYPDSYTWGPNQLGSHLEEFPEGQFVVAEQGSGAIIGMAASLIVDYSKYTLSSKWKDITEWGYFGTHDPLHGRTLYGAEVMVHPRWQGKGVGKALYRRREQLARERSLRNIRAGARISGYHRYAESLTALEYVDRVVRGELGDPTLSFQLKRGFHVVGVTPRYFYDPESRDYAAVIEWNNPDAVDGPRVGGEQEPESGNPSSGRGSDPVPPEGQGAVKIDSAGPADGSSE